MSLPSVSVFFLLSLTSSAFLHSARGLMSTSYKASLSGRESEAYHQICRGKNFESETKTERDLVRSKLKHERDGQVCGSSGELQPATKRSASGRSGAEESHPRSGKGFRIESRRRNAAALGSRAPGGANWSSPCHTELGLGCRALF